MTIVVIMFVVLVSGETAISRVPFHVCHSVDLAFRSGALIEIDTDTGRERVTAVACIAQDNGGSS